ncbi:mitochondrial carrier domain-containing protein [Radiomyces spectabilis]|uniref:mitochondrial carrier domain-containing protein n=1 Tax=Radiomyces spectabilis TaxID=64574 RepID=UPI00221FAA88|nr:mitochondrial carrier domain-containing protein [Radiomyces spectabilis]KAI8391541.1 mitochondrial carrier domain-containing protein [Radiomyces spectabilis]
MSDNVAHALSGAGGGIVSMALTYPLVSISSRLQVQKSDQSKDAYKNTMDAFFKILKSEGPKGLYSGLSSGVFGIAITNGVYYYCYEAVKSIFEKTKGKGKPMSTPESMLAGALAGCAVVLATHPIWTVNTRLTVRKGVDEEGQSKKSNAFAVGASILKKEGLAGLYSGVGAALVLVINPIIQYTAFEQIKNKISKMKTLSNLDFFLLGAISKLCATAITYPYIVIKSRMQVSQKKEERYTSIWDGFQKIIASEGIAGLYKGISSKIVQSVLTAAFLFMAKEALFDWAVWVLVLAGARKARLAGKS